MGLKHAGRPIAKSGVTGDFKYLSLILLACIVLPVLFWFSLYCDAVAVRSAAPLVFPQDRSRTSAPVVLSNGTSIAPSSSNEEKPMAAGPESEAHPSHWTKILGLLGKIAMLVVSPFIELWGLPYGILSVGISAMQAAAGWMCYWRYPPEMALGKRLKELLNQRPIPFGVFLVLDIGVAILATFRGIEFGLGTNVWVPGPVAGAIGLVTPWIQALLLHLFLECTSDLLAMASAWGAGAGIIVVSFAGFLAGSGMVTLIGFSLVCPLASAALVLCLAYFFVWFAETIGERARAVAQWFRTLGSGRRTLRDAERPNAQGFRSAAQAGD